MNSKYSNGNANCFFSTEGGSSSKSIECKWKIQPMCPNQGSAISGVSKLLVRADMLVLAQVLFGRQQQPCLHVLVPNLQQPLYNGPAHLHQALPLQNIQDKKCNKQNDHRHVAGITSMSPSVSSVAVTSGHTVQSIVQHV